MRFKQPALTLAVGMDVAPLIDVVFLQLIFFMLTSSFVVSSGIKVRLPQAASAASLSSAGVTLAITREGKLLWNQSPVTREELKKHLKAARSSPPSILLQAHAQARLGTVVEVWDLCRLMGLEEVAIAAVNPET